MGRCDVVSIRLRIITVETDGGREQCDDDKVREERREEERYKDDDKVERYDDKVRQYR